MSATCFWCAPTIASVKLRFAAALGAGRLAVARVFFVESALLSIAGGALGLMLAVAAVRLVVALAPASLPRLDEIRVDGVVVAFTFGIAMLAGIVFGAVQVRRRVEMRPRRCTMPAGATRLVVGASETRALLLGAQVAMALILLVASGLLVRSLENLRGADAGFNQKSALAFDIGLPEQDYPTRDAAVDSGITGSWRG